MLSTGINTSNLINFSLNTNLLINSPLEQFELLNISIFTNGQFFLGSAILVITFLWFNYNTEALWISSGSRSFSYIIEILYKELITLVFRNVGGAIGQLYFPWLVFTFFFVAMANLIGMIPFTFTVTSHIIVTFCLSFCLFIGINIRAVIDKQFSFFSLFLPSGAPFLIAPFLVLIELLSYIARVFSLAIRLFANMMAGHSLLKILIGFSYTIAFQSTSTVWPLYFVALIPFLIVFLITFLEVAIALLQGYVFTVLMCLYIKDLYTSH
jgi:F-type H+-transporting ATPase subunit a